MEAEGPRGKIARLSEAWELTLTLTLTLTLIGGKSTRLKEAWERVKQVVPPLNGSRYKGQSGRIGVLGGSALYTGTSLLKILNIFKS